VVPVPHSHNLTTVVDVVSDTTPQVDDLVACGGATGLEHGREGCPLGFDGLITPSDKEPDQKKKRELSHVAPPGFQVFGRASGEQGRLLILKSPKRQQNVTPPRRSPVTAVARHRAPGFAAATSPPSSREWVVGRQATVTFAARHRQKNRGAGRAYTLEVSVTVLSIAVGAGAGRANDALFKFVGHGSRHRSGRAGQRELGLGVGRTA